MQAFYLFRLQRDRNIAPAKSYIGVMALRLGKLADFLNEGESLAKVAEPETSLYSVSLVAEFPIWGLGMKSLRFFGR